MMAYNDRLHVYDMTNKEIGFIKPEKEDPEACYAERDVTGERKRKMDSRCVEIRDEYKRNFA